MNIDKEKLILYGRCLVSACVAFFYVARMFDNWRLFSDARKDYKELTKQMVKNNEEGKKIPNAFNSPDSNVNQWNKNNDENRQKARILMSDKTKDMFYDTAYLGGVIGVIWLKFGTAF